jgi:hypothetical protein
MQQDFVLMPVCKCCWSGSGSRWVSVLQIFGFGMLVMQMIGSSVRDFVVRTNEKSSVLDSDDVLPQT